MTKAIKKKAIITMTIIMIICIFALSGCSEKASKYTEEEHIQRVTERIQKRFMTEKFEFTSFDVYPLYNEKDELKYFLVEFEPYEFAFIQLRDEQLKAFGWLGASTSMYRLMGLHEKHWSPYTIDETNSQPSPDVDKCWKVDDNGEKIVYKKSPYSIANIENERKYLLQIDEQFIPAVKRGTMYLNLISMQETEFVNGHFAKKQAYALIRFEPPKKRFDL